MEVIGFDTDQHRRVAIFFFGIDKKVAAKAYAVSSLGILNCLSKLADRKARIGIKAEVRFFGELGESKSLKKKNKEKG
jgi:hypothetical protein